MLKKTFATGAVAIASAAILLSASPAAADSEAWTQNFDSVLSGNTTLHELENESEGCGISNAVLGGKSVGSCYNTGVIIQN
ncbi:MULTISPECIES: hypothetical protein [Nocardiopsidaceae]|uniref:Secreted protein n=2 Tax=Nocardiopsidaceae TaxID=83676 RepID=A0ABY6YLD7_9ACTN|nr:MULTISPECIES: hypothetical protein [Nocardiopsaceae]MEE2043497.1 hypothetical protein [Nocardiopsis tropica]MEE2051214.1 hypothetical protein [Nocardiopsis umidischolae]WAE73066.1 hypothetical protein OUQ99_28555 [Streptomonospora nanhaiensis]